MKSYECNTVVGMAIDPIHVGTGGARLGRVDLTIVRDPVTRVPKIPGSSLAGVYRAYAAMSLDKYPACAGQGQASAAGQSGHCGKPDCPICVVFGFARGLGGGFAGLAAFGDAHLLLFPVATREGPLWVTCPGALRLVGCEAAEPEEDKLYRAKLSNQPLNLGWLLLEVKVFDEWTMVEKRLSELNIPEYIQPKSQSGQSSAGSYNSRVGLLSDKLFNHVVNSNLEVRTSVSINPQTGAAEEGALFSYEALPRATFLVWDVVCKHPDHFQVGGGKINASINSTTISTPSEVFEVVKTAHPYLEHLGIGGMGTRGMGRLRVLYHEACRQQPRPETGGIANG